MKYIILIIGLFLSVSAIGQSKGYLRYDSLYIIRPGSNAELILENGTKNVTGGVLTNIGNGRTRFITPAGSTNSSLGSAFKVAVDGTNNVKSIFLSNGLTGDSATSGQVGIKWGGTLTANTTVDADSNTVTFSKANVVIDNNTGIGASDAQFPLIVRNTASGAVKTAKFEAPFNEIEVNTNGTSPNAFASLVFNHNGGHKASFGYDGGTTPHMYMDMRNGMFFNMERGSLGGTTQWTWDGRLLLGLDTMGVIIGDRSKSYSGLSMGKKLTIHGGVYINKDSIVLRTTNGTRQMLAYDTATGYVERMDIPAGGGPTPGLQDVITEDNALTGSNSITFTGGSLLTNGANVFWNLDDAGGDIGAVATDDFSITAPDVILATAPTLATDTSTHKYLGRNSSTGEIFLMPAPAGGSSGLTVGTTTISSSNNTSGGLLYDSTGILKNDPLFSYTGRELKIGSTTDRGAYAFQLTGSSIIRTATDGDFAWRMESANGNRYIRMYIDNSGNGIYDVDNNAIFRVSNNSYFSIPSTGNAVFNRGLIMNEDGTTANTRIESDNQANMFLVDATNDRVGFGVGSPTARVHLMAGSTAASSAPLKFTSGSLQTTAEAGAIEFLTDKFYATITTSAARKEITLNDAALTSGTVPVATTNGRLTDGLVISQGTYTPTLTNSTNVSASTAYACQYMRVGNTVTVSGMFEMTVTGAGLNTELGISLPIASNLANSQEAAGTGSSPSYVEAYSIIGDGTNDRAKLNSAPAGTGNRLVYFTFTYRII